MAIDRSTFGVRDASAEPAYRLFVIVESAALNQVSTASGSGPATLAARGQLMGTGRFEVTGRLRSDAAGADVALDLAVRDLALPTLNDALVAHG
ncbi:MAG: DUF748 domain-containing protein, partial [Candidatus Rokuibacteriota bacterium]